MNPADPREWASPEQTIILSDGQIFTPPRDQELPTLDPGLSWWDVRIDGEMVKVAATDKAHLAKVLKLAYPGAKVRGEIPADVKHLLNRFKRRPNARQRARAAQQARPQPKPQETPNP